MILGMKVRKEDLQDMLKFQPKVLEFHFSDSDLQLKLDKHYDQKLIVHCYEYFERRLLDIVSLKETNQVHSREKSIELIQKAIDKAISLNEHFEGKPTIIVHPGGYSLEEPDESTIKDLKDLIVDSINQLETKNVNFLLENMPPYAWFFGGRWNCSVFLSADEMLHYCKKTGLKVCFDLCHSQLFCNKTNRSLIEELKKIQDIVDHFHLSDAGGLDGEGLQFGEGSIDFNKIIPILNKNHSKSFVIEVWKGHENHGRGFAEFLDKIKKRGLIVN